MLLIFWQAGLRWELESRHDPSRNSAAMGICFAKHN